MRKPEQICRHEPNTRYRKWLKRLAHRLLRRLAKQNPKDAPRRTPFRGYST